MRTDARRRLQPDVLAAKAKVALLHPSGNSSNYNALEQPTDMISILLSLQQPHRRHQEVHNHHQRPRPSTSDSPRSARGRSIRSANGPRVPSPLIVRPSGCRFHPSSENGSHRDMRRQPPAPPGSPTMYLDLSMRGCSPTLVRRGERGSLVGPRPAADFALDEQHGSTEAQQGLAPLCFSHLMGCSAAVPDVRSALVRGYGGSGGAPPLPPPPPPPPLALASPAASGGAQAADSLDPSKSKRSARGRSSQLRPATPINIVTLAGGSSPALGVPLSPRRAKVDLPDMPLQPSTRLAHSAGCSDPLSPLGSMTAHDEAAARTASAIKHWEEWIDEEEGVLLEARRALAQKRAAEQAEVPCSPPRAASSGGEQGSTSKPGVARKAGSDWQWLADADSVVGVDDRPTSRPRPARSSNLKGFPARESRHWELKTLQAAKTLQAELATLGSMGDDRLEGRHLHAVAHQPD